MFRYILRPLLGLGLLFILLSPLAAVAAPPPPGSTYVVQRGDTLAKIAARLGVSQSALARANGIGDANLIYAGQRLVVPGSTSSASDAPAAPRASTAGQAVAPDQASSAVDSGQGQTGIYVVRRGDTLSSIARRLGVSLQDLLSANHLSNANFVYVGQRLVVSVSQPQPQPAPAELGPVANPGSQSAPDSGGNGDLTPPDAGTGQAPDTGAGPAQGTAANATPDTGAGQAAGAGAGQVQGADANAAPDAGAAPTPDGAAGQVPETVPTPGPDGAVIVPSPDAAAAAAADEPHPTPEGADPNAVAEADAAQADRAAKAERWIDVNLSAQSLTAYEGKRAVFTTRISSGRPRTPTVTGTYKIYVKIPSQTMSGPGYRLPGVPYVMFFYKGYGIHGTYWHNNFGHPMSHGCVNVSTPDAAWLYGWARVGTRLVSHY